MCAASLGSQAIDHLQLLDTVAQLPELLAHNVALFPFLPFIERSLHDLLEQDKAQVLKLGALIVIEDSF